MLELIAQRDRKAARIAELEQQLAQAWRVGPPTGPRRMVKYHLNVFLHDHVIPMRYSDDLPNADGFVLLYRELTPNEKEADGHDA